MGWKTFRDRFNIQFPVFCSKFCHIQIYGDGWSIYCYNDGKISFVTMPYYHGFKPIASLYNSTEQDRIDAINAVDKFDNDLPLFLLKTPNRYDGIGDYSIQTLMCESYGDDGYFIYDKYGLRTTRQNRIKTTHCGMPIYDFDGTLGTNFFFKTKEEAIDFAFLDNAQFIDKVTKEKEKAVKDLLKLQNQKYNINML